MNLLEVKNISKTYGNGETAVKALKDVSFSVPKGEYVAIVGESGSGKSTLLNMIGALDTPTSGKVLIDGKDIFAMNDRKLCIRDSPCIPQHGGYCEICGETDCSQ